MIGSSAIVLSALLMCVATDTDCAVGNVCDSATRKCKCHSSFYFDAKAKACHAAPSKVGESCQKPILYCKPPLTCEGNNMCVCPFGKLKNGECFRATYNLACTDNADCTDPFTYCDKSVRRCSCMPGAKSTNGKCTMSLNCPDNKAPNREKCRVLSGLHSDLFENAQNSGNTQDDCDRGSYCVTDGISPLGICCNATCPFGQKAESGRSCERDTCEGEHLYCHRLIGPSFSTSICCQKPCSEAAPVFVEGKCHSRSSLNGKCDVTEQCDGGDTMLCSSGICQCRKGYKTVPSGSEKGLTCAKDCGKQEAIGDICLNNDIGHGQQCKIGIQCSTTNATCSHGVCACECGFNYQGNKCVPVGPNALPTKTPSNQPAPTIGGFIGDLIAKLGR